MASPLSYGGLAPAMRCWPFRFVCQRSKAINPMESSSMGLESSSIVHNIETSVEFNSNTSYRNHRVSFHAAELDAARLAYLELPYGKGIKKVDSLDTCRSRAYFYRHEETGMVKVISSCCRLRWCPMCTEGRKFVITEAVSGWMQTVQRPKFLTLTLRHTSAPLASQLTHLYDSFRKFRLSKYIRNYVEGGVWFFQVKKSEDGFTWHPHLHCLIDSSWLDHGTISSLWLSITKTSCVVDIKAVHSAKNVTEYVARYAAKPAELSSICCKDRIELMEALHGKRIVGSWGNAKSLSFRPKRPDDAGMWKGIGKYQYVVDTMDSYSPARAIYRAWKLSEPLEAGTNMQEIEDFVNDHIPWPNLEKKSTYKQWEFEFH